MFKFWLNEQCPKQMVGLLCCRYIIYRKCRVFYMSSARLYSVEPPPLCAAFLTIPFVRAADFRRPVIRALHGELSTGHPSFKDSILFCQPKPLKSLFAMSTELVTPWTTVKQLRAMPKVWPSIVTPIRSSPSGGKEEGTETDRYG